MKTDKFEVLDFIDFPDLRAYHRNTDFSPAQAAVLVGKSQKRNILEKFSALEQLLHFYTKEEFQDERVTSSAENGEVPFFQVIWHTRRVWKEILDAREKKNGFIFAAALYARDTESRGGYQYFSEYENAYAYLKREKEYYLSRKNLCMIKTAGIILRIKLDDVYEADYDEYWFDDEMRLIRVNGRWERYWIHENQAFDSLEKYQFYLPVPFRKGDFVRIETFDRKSYWGEVCEDYRKAAFPEFDTMNIRLKCMKQKEKYLIESADILQINACTSQTAEDINKRMK